MGICSLYNWRYKSLGNLPHVLNSPDYRTANAGFSFDYQLINVPDFNGVGESQPSPFFYQNLAEAEYVVHVYMYMRLMGYEAHKISILTTYNGQKALIKDVCNARCANNPLIGMPHKIATVDKYQGQQNDYILLSLVRTYNVGHLRDVRRLVVAMSRARLLRLCPRHALQELFRAATCLQHSHQKAAAAPPLPNGAEANKPGGECHSTNANDYL